MTNFSINRFRDDVYRTESYVTPGGTSVEVHNCYEPKKGLTGHNKITLLAKDHPLRNAGVAGFVYGTNVDAYVKGEDGKPLSQSRTLLVPANYNERPLKQRSSLVMIDENSQELARGNKEIKELIKSLKEHGLKIAKQKDNFISKIFKSIK